MTTNQLLAQYPKLSEALTPIELGQLPTPVRALDQLEQSLGATGLFIKQDDLSGAPYGGNKVRKLEFLLGEAVANGHKAVITYGAAGSNHALATAVYAREIGLACISILAPQETTDHVRKNLLAEYGVGADVRLCAHYTDFPKATKAAIDEYTARDGVEPYIIPTGGTNVVGALGFVSAGLELAAQIHDGLLPEPSRIYLPMGTGGTIAGLIIGLRLAGIHSRVIPVRVVDAVFRSPGYIVRLFNDVISFLREHDSSIPKLTLTPEEVGIRDEFYGEGYGIATVEGKAAVELFLTAEGIQLENTYTGKAAAAFVHDVKARVDSGESLLFWNTLNSHDLSTLTADVDPAELPTSARAYWTP